MPDVAPAEANPTGEPTGEPSFKERMRLRLAAERTSGEPVEPPAGYEEVNPSEQPESDIAKVGDGYEEALDPARQPEAEVEPELDPEVEPTVEAEVEGALTKPSSEPEAAPEITVSDEHAELIERADVAEERAKSMERDYRIKTHKIADATRALEDQTGVVKTQADFILNEANMGVSQFDNIDWNQLRTKPEEYQRMKQMFEQACTLRDRLVNQLGGIAEHHKQMREIAKSREADVSKDILRSTITDWSNEMYGKLRGYAVEELSYTAAEFDDMTDWRRLRDIHAQYELAQAPKTVIRLQRKKGKTPVNRQRELPTGKAANPRGDLQKARQDLEDNPGEPRAKRNFFQQKMAAERRR